MSYLPNGSTLRATFHKMEPMRHHMDPSQSEVIAHIRRTLDYDQESAERAFNSMRNAKSGVLVFDRVHRVWYGCDWTPDDEEAKKEFFTQRFAEMKREVASLRDEVRDLAAMQKKLIKGMDHLWDFIETGKANQEEDGQPDEEEKRKRIEAEQKANLEAARKLPPPDVRWGRKKPEMDAGQQMKNAVEMAWG